MKYTKHFRTRDRKVSRRKTHNLPPKKRKKADTRSHPLEAAKEISWRGSTMSRGGKGGRHNRRLRRRIKQRLKRR